MAKVPVTMKDSILDRLDEIRQRIAERAFELFRGRGGSSNDPVADWLTAEQEILWKPTIELREDDGVFVVVAALPGLETKDVTVEVTPQDLVIRAETSHTRSESKDRVHLSEFRQAEVFRSLPFPRPIDPAQVKAELRNGLLKITAPIAETMQATSVRVKAA